MCIYPIGVTPACRCAAKRLEQAGLSLIDHPSPDVTHLLLDVPAFRPDGLLRSGEELEPILSMLPGSITILGGNLSHPALKDYLCIDLLQDPLYLAHNAAITADCALRLAGSRMTRTFSETAALVIGWGRIGKCLSRLLQQVGCRVIVAERSPAAMAMAQALGYETIPLHEIPIVLSTVTLLFNTVPAPILDVPVPVGCVALELASKPGIPAENVIPAGGLPGKMAPDSSGKRIADTILQHIEEECL